ncbi:lysine--tRNA ligase [Flavobacteriales bacterium]|nr:lysine--tRNA ligase [Flavobacteriales bacterium]MDC0303816.1 lysine--tRNA ligase [Flavobacteriales bacterium]
MQELSEQEVVRREALQKLKDLGIEPYPAEEFQVNITSEEVKKQFVDGDEMKDVVLAGRMMSSRIMGKASFAELQDATGRVQLYITRDDICSGEDKTMYNEVFKRLLDRGDFIGVKGYVFKTQVGEVSVHVQELTVLGKSLKPLPVVKTDAEGNVHDAVSDAEFRYRQRYVDLVVNPDSRDAFIKRSKMFNSMRQFFNDHGLLEVETPILQPIAGGAAARPFETHHNSLDIPLYMRIANELYLKRLIVGGFDGVYEFAKVFRNEGMDRTHNPEFSMLEIYVAYKDYNWMMDFTERMLEKVAIDLNGTTKVTYGDVELDFKAPYPRVPMYEAIETHTGIDVSEMDEAALLQVCKDLEIPTDDTMGRGKLIDEIFGEKCEHHYVQPTFITDYPVEMSPLTKKHRSKPGLVERFELMACGTELANAYSELNDPLEQRARFEEQMELADRGDDEAMIIDHDFLRALEYGMPPTSGMGIGMDRLCMMLTNNSSIQDVLFFPQMRPERVEKKIELEGNDKVIFDILSKEGIMNLVALKEQSGLSNKQWDKGMKALTKAGLIKVTKSDDGLTVEVV